MIIGAILAGGIGKRMGAVDKPKQFLEVGGTEGGERPDEHQPERALGVVEREALGRVAAARVADDDRPRWGGLPLRDGVPILGFVTGNRS